MHHDEEQMPIIEIVCMTGDICSLEYQAGWPPKEAPKHFEAAVGTCKANGGHPGWHEITSNAAMKEEEKID